MKRVVQVRLREQGPLLYYIVEEELKVKIGDCVIVEAERGIDYGEVLSDIEEIDNTDEPLRKIIRIASDSDLREIEENRLRAEEALYLCSEKITEHHLPMKLIEAEYSFDRSKVIFYFTAEGRVDFRELLKDLAKIFKTRIELRQIGVRDEAKLFGGYGPCGRKLCCATFLEEFVPVTIKMVKEQNLALNPPKLSGVCGRLMCCLSFEYQTYKELSEGLPKIGKVLATPEGKGKVISVNPLKRSVTVEIGEGRQIEIFYK
jgi:cell fate regulator YaaT (PSP1 superfamily)